MKSKVKYLILLLLPLLLLTGCISGGQIGVGNFDVLGFLNHPIVMFLIFIAVLWFAFKHSKK